ncbi:MAG: NAD(P)/FAD-dependent oxidoreductase [Candidatus Firestonebacteria bacterium]|nr:NAD(P)/FAD-dependent oxidoreductase [Candidatus Firestonebacteria bacterium]
MLDLLVIGGGPAGIMAAITAAGKNKNVLLLDKNPSLGRKLLASGNGKCNLSNSTLVPDNYFGNKLFLKNIFAKFNNKTLDNFFKKRGVLLKTEEFGRVLPFTESSASILDCLQEEIAVNKVMVKNSEQVLSIEKNENIFTVKTGRGVYETRNILIAAGSSAYPQLGSTGSGYELAGNLGHTIKPLRPALVPLELEGNWFHKLQGVHVDAGIFIEKNGKKKDYFGELLFTKYGISGPVTLDASLSIIDGIKERAEVYLNLLPVYEDFIHPELKAMLSFRPEKTIVAFLSGFLPKKIAVHLLPQMEIDPLTKVKDLSREDIEKIFNTLRNWHVKVIGPKSYSEAMAVAGGVSTDEISADTMESKLVPGVYFAGEVIDVVGESGGFNIQFAFSSGYIAGKSIK